MKYSALENGGSIISQDNPQLEQDTTSTANSTKYLSDNEAGSDHVFDKKAGSDQTSDQDARSNQTCDNGAGLERAYDKDAVSNQTHADKEAVSNQIPDDKEAVSNQIPDDKEAVSNQIPDDKEVVSNQTCDDKDTVSNQTCDDKETLSKQTRDDKEPDSTRPCGNKEADLNHAISNVYENSKTDHTTQKHPTDHNINNSSSAVPPPSPPSSPTCSSSSSASSALSSQPSTSSVPAKEEPTRRPPTGAENEDSEGSIDSGRYSTSPSSVAKGNVRERKASDAVPSVFSVEYLLTHESDKRKRPPDCDDSKRHGNATIDSQSTEQNPCFRVFSRIDQGKKYDCRANQDGTFSKSVGLLDPDTFPSSSSASYNAEYSSSEECESNDVSQSASETPDTKIRGKRKLKRTKYSKEQLNKLNTMFVADPWLSPEKQEALAREMGYTDVQIKTWFQNRRSSKFGSRRPKRRLLYDMQLAQGHMMTPSPTRSPHANIITAQSTGSTLTTVKKDTCQPRPPTPSIHSTSAYRPNENPDDQHIKSIQSNVTNFPSTSYNSHQLTAQGTLPFLPPLPWMASPVFQTNTLGPTYLFQQPMPLPPPPAHHNVPSASRSCLTSQLQINRLTGLDANPFMVPGSSSQYPPFNSFHNAQVSTSSSFGNIMNTNGMHRHNGSSSSTVNDGQARTQTAHLESRRSLAMQPSGLGAYTASLPSTSMQVFHRPWLTEPSITTLRHPVAFMPRAVHFNTPLQTNTNAVAALHRRANEEHVDDKRTLSFNDYMEHFTRQLQMSSSVSSNDSNIKNIDACASSERKYNGEEAPDRMDVSPQDVENIVVD